MSESKPPYWSSQHLFQSFSIDAKAAAIEFVGTTFFFLLGLGGIQAATGESLQSGPTIEHTPYIATSTGFNLVAAWLFYRIFNPNITLAVLLVGAVSPVRFVLFVSPRWSSAFSTPAYGYAVNARTKREFSAKKAI